jgi:HlyD family secretion protein
MTATAEVIVGQRTVLSYFLYPLMRAVDESIRER